MNILTLIFDSIVNIIMFFRRHVAVFLLKYILGWRVNITDKTYQHLKKGKHVLVYSRSHISTYKSLVGYLVSLVYGLFLITIYEKEMCEIPLLIRIFKNVNVIMIGRKKNNAKYIVDELNKFSNYVLAIELNNSRSNNIDINSDFFLLAKSANADINISRFDFVNHIISIEELVDISNVMINKYESIKAIVENELSKEKSYNCHLANTTINETSLICTKRSILIYTPPLIVLYIIFNVISQYY